MTEREELLAIAERLDAWAGPVSSGQDAALAMRDAAKALRSAASTGPDVANQTVSAIIDEMANDWLTPNWHRQFRKDCENLIREAIAAPTPLAGESVTVEELADAIATASLTLPGDDHAARVSRKLLSTFTITRKSEARS